MAADCEWSLDDVIASGTVPACYCAFPTMVPPNGTACSWLFADNVRRDYDSASTAMRVCGYVFFLAYEALLWHRHLKRPVSDIQKYGFWSVHWMRHSVEAPVLLLGIAASLGFIAHSRNLLAYDQRERPHEERLRYAAMDFIAMASGLTAVAFVVHRWARLLRPIGVQPSRRAERLRAAVHGLMWPGAAAMSVLEMVAVPDPDGNAAVYNNRCRAARLAFYTASVALSFTQVLALRRALRTPMTGFARAPPPVRRLSRIIHLMLLFGAPSTFVMVLLTLGHALAGPHGLILPPEPGAWRFWWVGAQLAPHAVAIVVMSLNYASKPGELRVALRSVSAAPGRGPGPGTVCPAPGPVTPAPATVSLSDESVRPAG